MEIAENRNPRRMGWLHRLVAVHLLLAVAPLALYLIPAHVDWLPAMWTLGSITIGQLWLLGFWVGLGSGRVVRRLGLALLACAYMAGWIAAGWTLAARGDKFDGIRMGGAFAAILGRLGAALLVITAAFLVLRRWYGELQRLNEPEAGETSPRLQYSILHLLVITSAAAVVLSLMRTARGSGELNATSWQLAASHVLMIVSLLGNALCAAWAALAPGAIRRRISMAFLVAALLGLAMGYTGRSVAWWLPPCFALVTIVPTAIVVGSLLVARRQSYRLVTKR